MTKLISTREAYGRALVELGAQYRFFVLDADLSKATQTCLFHDAYPTRFFNMGISEADMMTTAAGMASCGNTVVASTFALFATGRAYEQVRNSIAYTGANVKIAASHCGVLIGEDGASHQCFEDIGLMRMLPGMTVIAPCDQVSTRWALESALTTEGPFYLRLNRYPVPSVYQEDAHFQLGRGNIIVQYGSDAVILAHGDLVCESARAAEILKSQGIHITVADIHTIKPLDCELISTLASKTPLVVTAEDHSVTGGLGSAVSELMAEQNFGASLYRIGIPDCFGRSGSRASLASHFGLTGESIAAQCLSALTRHSK